MKVIVAVAAFVILGTTSASAADLRITQVVGTVVEVRNVTIDYTQYSMLYTPDFERSGIRKLAGTVYWSDVARIEITGRDSHGLSAIIVGKDGKTSEMTLKRDSDKGLRGVTDLGDFFIALDKIRLIEVLKTN